MAEVAQKPPTEKPQGLTPILQVLHRCTALDMRVYPAISVVEEVTFQSLNLHLRNGKHDWYYHANCPQCRRSVMVSASAAIYMLEESKEGVYTQKASNERPQQTEKVYPRKHPSRNPYAMYPNITLKAVNHYLAQVDKWRAHFTKELPADEANKKATRMAHELCFAFFGCALRELHETIAE